MNLTNTHTIVRREKGKKLSRASLSLQNKEKNQVQGFVKVLKYIWTMVFTWDLTGTWSRFIRETNASCPVEGN